MLKSSILRRKKHNRRYKILNGLHKKYNMTKNILLLWSIELICGSMFSWKTEEFIRRIKRAILGKKEVILFKPAIDNRYHETQIVSHDGTKISSYIIQKTSDIVDHLSKISKKIDVIGIDEAQFFDNNIINLCNKLADDGIRVIIAGLDLDFAGKPFGPMPWLMAISDEVIKLKAICTSCWSNAHYTHRLSPSSDQVVIWSTDIYTALCRNCYHKYAWRPL